MPAQSGTSTRRRTYLIQDPYTDYALEFIRRIFTQFGLRPICFHTDRQMRFYNELENPVLRSDLIEASVDVDDLASFAATLRPSYDVVAVIPHNELTVGPAAELCDLLEIDWNPSEVIRRFRDKNTQKQQLHEMGIRVPFCRIVDDATQLRSESLPERFVLKPNDGYGNIGIGIFHRSELVDAEQHVTNEPSTTWLLEEFIDGTEYNINGQVRADGRVDIYAIFEYTRRVMNGHHTVYDCEIQCPSTHPLFAQLVRYTTDVMCATGLRRSPFHLEVMVDVAGPCMIDLAARMGGCGASHTISRSHPGLPDLFAIAAHDYIDRSDFATEPVDWRLHDANLSMFVYGLSDEDLIVQSLTGLEAVEALPEFVAWVTKPRVGDRIRRTEELLSAPFILDLRRPADEVEARATADRVRSLIHWNVESSRVHAVSAKLRRKVSHLPRRLRWESHRLLERMLVKP